MNSGTEQSRKKLIDLYDEDVFVKLVSEELRRHGVSDDSIGKAVDRLRDPVLREEFIKSALKEAPDTYAQIAGLSAEVAILRDKCNVAARLCGEEPIFHSSSETNRISVELTRHAVVDEHSLQLFVNMLYKYLVESADYGQLRERSEIKSAIEKINIYRQSFAHIFDLKGGGEGTKRAYKDLAKANEEFLGHRVVRKDEYPHLQIRILQLARDMLDKICENFEEWVSTS
ncbi:MAG: hypothetical protein KAR39_04300 [Thermoplasmata archaeon]|nr:hypothetical protein [Thermoplasmata archaeon]